MGLSEKAQKVKGGELVKTNKSVLESRELIRISAFLNSARRYVR
jgi:hypothetical protein